LDKLEARSWVANQTLAIQVLRLFALTSGESADGRTKPALPGFKEFSSETSRQKTQLESSKGESMKSIVRKCLAGLMLLVALAAQIGAAAQDQQEHDKKQTHYMVTNLGSLGGTNCCLVVTINNRGWVDGTSNLAGDQSFHPFLWRDGKMQDLGTLGGPNASAGGMNEVGDVTVGGSDTGIPDPLGEDACGFGTFQTCLSFIWHNGRRTLIPTLGGNNNDVNTIDNRGRVLAFAETTAHDPTCIAPQVLGYGAFIWDPDKGGIHRLPPLTGDSVSVAFSMNNAGQAVGYSGGCGKGLGDFLSAFHAVRWQNGIPTDLGNLGGTIVNTGFGINNRGQVAGVSALPGNTIAHAFLWDEEGGMRDLGTLPGDTNSFSGNINDEGQVPIQSCDANFNNCRAAIWQDGVMTDLNTLIPPGSSLFLTLANSINSRGEIVGAAVDQSTGATVPFLAVPCDENHPNIESCDYSMADATTAPAATPAPAGQAMANQAGALSQGAANPMLRRWGGRLGPWTRGLGVAPPASELNGQSSSSTADQQTLACAETQGVTDDATTHHGYCRANLYTGRLDGYCTSNPSLFHCVSAVSAQCPSGAPVVRRSQYVCSRCLDCHPTLIDLARPCSF
jgi:probable HAF family extracellular repeat protein